MVARRLSHLGAFGLLAASLPGVAASQQVPATASIVGRLVDVESRAPVGRARIAILGAHHELASDSEGRFVGDHLASGTYVLQARAIGRSEEHTSELQSRLHLVCRLLLEKKKK